jgi:hypothetical protein
MSNIFDWLNLKLRKCEIVFFCEIQEFIFQTIEPPQLDPAPAVHPKQCLSVKISTFSNSSTDSMSKIVTFLFNSKAPLKSQS